jgi:hypothetical protein
MATLVLQTAGQALGGALAGPIGAAIGQAAGGIAGSIVDQALFGPPPRQIEGPRLNDLHVTGSTEGAPVPVAWGRMRLAGQLIWATPFEEEITHRKQGGGKGSLSRPTVEYTEYSYYGNFAIALCEGPIDRIGRVWADGKEINPAQLVWRLHKGTSDQQPDSLIEAREGQAAAPAYRGIAYVVFERLPLAPYGNRLPQLSFEVFRGLDGFETSVRAVNIIPGSTEFGYDTQQVPRGDGFGGTQSENVHTFQDKSDFVVSLDQLQATCPNVSAANLVVAWFGDDLRCGECTIKPRIDNRDKQTVPVNWQVAGQTRQTAALVSQVEGRAAYGGTPDDGSIIRAISELKARGLDVCFYPFVLMDIAADNQLENPFDGNIGQPAYPWRGLIGCSPAIGRAGTVDGSPAAQAQVEAFFGTAQISDFAIVDGAVTYSGPADWSYRRMILHYANLCAIAGGVESFLVGTELVQLNRTRNGNGEFVAVEQLRLLAADVAAILPGASISYAADWSEYANYRPDDGSGDVWFHLDALWADPNVSFIGIDNYMPLSDWRDGQSHLDRLAGWPSVRNSEYLKANVAGGEGFDWYYASEQDRALQVRTPIADTAYGKHWVFRTKDIANWWQNQHWHRPAGVESATPTGWQPMSKPVRFTEVGFPAVDKGTNQPNVFVDAKSSSSALPYFSNGGRDDLLQRAALSALEEYWSDAGNNPVSPVYGTSMVDTANMAIWAWDARPFPAFPMLSSIWSDGDNHELGHWLNGRMGALELGALVAAVFDHYGFDQYDTSELSGVVEGFAIDRPMSARAALEALFNVFLIDAVESDGVLKLSLRQTGQALVLAADQLVQARDDEPLLEVRRAQETELPSRLSLTFSDSSIDYRSATVHARQLPASTLRHASMVFPGVLGFGQAQAYATQLIRSAWASREKATFVLPPSLSRVEPGDLLQLDGIGPVRTWRVVEVRDAGAREVTAVLHDADAVSVAEGPSRRSALAAPAVAGRLAHAVLDLPVISGNEDPFAPWVAASGTPWPGHAGVYQLQGQTSFASVLSLQTPAIIGVLLDDLPAGTPWLWDCGSSVRVRLSSGQLASVEREDVLAGSNMAVVGDQPGSREVLQFQFAQLVADKTYRLSNLLRGQAGTEGDMAGVLPAGSQFVLLDGAVRQLTPAPGNIGREFSLRIGPGGTDPADPRMQDSTFVFSGRGLRPLSPVHLRASVDNGDVQLSWIRRTRIAGDSWELAEVPLGEDAELYEVQVSDGTQVVRTITTQTTAAIYGAADQQADFGTSLPAGLEFTVYQVSPVYGRGAAARTTLS